MIVDLYVPSKGRKDPRSEDLRSALGAAGGIPGRARAGLADMLAARREAGWGNYSLFLTEDGLLVGYLD